MCPHAYGERPPKVYFEPPVPHVNADESGRIACAYLAGWTLESNMLELCETIYKLMHEPEVDYCLDETLLAKWRSSPSVYSRAVKALLKKGSS